MEFRYSNEKSLLSESTFQELSNRLLNVYIGEALLKWSMHFNQCLEKFKSFSVPQIRKRRNPSKSSWILQKNWIIIKNRRFTTWNTNGPNLTSVSKRRESFQSQLSLLATFGMILDSSNIWSWHVKTCLTIRTKNRFGNRCLPQVLEGPPYIVELSFRHLNTPITVHIVVIVSNASQNVGFCRLNKNY